MAVGVFMPAEDPISLPKEGCEIKPEQGRGPGCSPGQGGKDREAAAGSFPRGGAGGGQERSPQEQGQGAGLTMNAGGGTRLCCPDPGATAPPQPCQPPQSKQSQRCCADIAHGWETGAVCTFQGSRLINLVPPQSF